MTVALVFLLAFLSAVVPLMVVVHTLIVRQARERDRLINQICHLAGKPWQPAPSTETAWEPDDVGPPALVDSPEQLPDY